MSQRSGLDDHVESRRSTLSVHFNTKAVQFCSRSLFFCGGAAAIEVDHVRSSFDVIHQNRDPQAWHFEVLIGRSNEIGTIADAIHAAATRTAVVRRATPFRVAGVPVLVKVRRTQGKHHTHILTTGNVRIAANQTEAITMPPLRLEVYARHFRLMYWPGIIGSPKLAAQSKKYTARIARIRPPNTLDTTLTEQRFDTIGEKVWKGLGICERCQERNQNQQALRCELHRTTSSFVE